MTLVAPDHTSPQPDDAASVKPSPTTAVRTGARKAYLHHLDLIRATTFSLVIFVHCLTQTTNEELSVGINATSLLLHFTRNTFFALTGFVLMYQNYEKRDFSTLDFWRRRIKLVIFPYVIWSTVYFVVTVMWAQGRIADLPFSLREYVWNLSWGLAGFQMYFLFVMLQVYLLFPALLWVIRKTTGHHGAVLAISAALQVVLVSAFTHWQPTGALGTVWWHNYATFLPYQFFVVYGAIAAVHRERIGEWLRGRGWILASALLITASLALATYLIRVFVDDQKPLEASSAFQPTLIPFLVVAIACLYAVALHWNNRWRGGTPRFAKAVSWASNRSFGVFLAHVLVLFLILRPVAASGGPWMLAHVPQPFATFATYALTLVGSLIVVEVLRRLPGSIYLTGRPRMPLPSLRALLRRTSAPAADVTADQSARGLASTSSRP
ncbi:acyltransferase [Gordonia sp. TBRC 11910]|uniref:Acyltransferase n=1 Tax=Gordonia asplenii TaxID=2725283 RepID=A0A848KX33_9ACTN|nr:acyltransferase [Gordonia asplenii]